MLQMERITFWLKTNFLSIVSRLIAVYFFWAFHIHVGFPPTGFLTYTAATYLVLFIFFLVLPFTKRIKLGKLIEFEAKVEQVQADIKEVRTETRELISTVSSVVNSISVSANQSVAVNLPGPEEAREAQEQLSIAHTKSPNLTREERESLAYLGAADSLEMNYALAHLRIDLERELRRIVGQNVESDVILGMRGGFLSAPGMFRRLGKILPRYKDMESSYLYVLKVCNGAIHGRQIPDNIAREAIDMGIRILRELELEEKLEQ